MRCSSFFKFHESYWQKQHVVYKLRSKTPLIRSSQNFTNLNKIYRFVSPNFYNLDEWLLQTEWSWNICFAKHLNKSILVRATSSCMHHNRVKIFMKSHTNSYNLTSFILTHIRTCLPGDVFLCSFIRSFVGSFVCSFIHLFVCSFVCFFRFVFCLFVHLFIHLFID